MKINMGIIKVEVNIAELTTAVRHSRPIGFGRWSLSRSR
jgi:hypothetical protein